jgi:hypothetical protein
VQARLSFWISPSTSGRARILTAGSRSWNSKLSLDVDFASGTCNLATSRHSFVISFVTVGPYRTLHPSLIVPFLLFLQLVILIGNVAVPEKIPHRESKRVSPIFNVRLVGYSKALQTDCRFDFLGMIPFCTIARRQRRLSINTLLLGKRSNETF